MRNWEQIHTLQTRGIRAFLHAEAEGGSAVDISSVRSVAVGQLIKVLRQLRRIVRESVNMSTRTYTGHISHLLVLRNLNKEPVVDCPSLPGVCEGAPRLLSTHYPGFQLWCVGTLLGGENLATNTPVASLRSSDTDEVGSRETSCLPRGSHIQSLYQAR